MANALTSSGLFGQLFQSPEIAELFSAETMTTHMLAFERAWTTALAAEGVFDAGAAQAALAAMDHFTPDLPALARAADRDGLPVPELVRQIKAAASPAAQSAIHTGATSQDLIDTALMLACKETFALLSQHMETALGALDGLIDAHGTKPLTAHTRMQAALPMRVADRTAVWRAGLVRVASQTPDLALQYGGPVGDRRKVGGKGDVIAASLAETLGLANAPCWHTERARITDIGHWLMQAAGACGKIGQDVALMAQMGQIKLSGTGGSSAMPHKQNPVRAETLVSLARYVAAQQGALGQSLVHEQERSGAAWGLEWMILPDICEAAGASLVGLCGLLSQIDDLGDTT